MDHGLMMVIPDIYSFRRLLAHRAYGAPISICPGRPNGYPSQRVLVCPAPALFHLLFETRSPTDCSTYGEDDIQVQLTFYSTFEVLDLPCSGLMEMETRCIVKLYTPSPTHILFEGPVSNVLGLVPLTLLFLSGNSTQTIWRIPAMQEEARSGHAIRTKRRLNAPTATAAQ